MLLALLLSKECEVNGKSNPINPGTVVVTETAPLLGNGSGNEPAQQTDDDDDSKKNRKRFRLLPEISKESQVVLLQLCILFAFDNFASGLAPL